jgi:hypothetical protein
LSYKYELQDSNNPTLHPRNIILVKPGSCFSYFFCCTNVKFYIGNDSHKVKHNELPLVAL